MFRPKMFEHGERKTALTLYHLKSRFEELGHPCALRMDYDLKTRRFKSVDYEEADGEAA